MRTFLLLLGALATLSSPLSAQINLVATLAGRYETIRSLEIAGPKFIERNATGFNLYNTDLTPFAGTIYPSIPPNYNLGNYPLPQYITESLFDNDPATIEYILLLFRNDYAYSATLIARLDGTVLLLDTLFGPGGVNGQDLFNTSPTIFQTNLGPQMVLNQGINTASRIYTLPGSLPCIDCAVNITTGQSEVFTPGPVMHVFPNPATGQVRIEFSGLSEGGPSSLRVHDVSGRMVLLFEGITGDRFEFSVAGLSAGAYELILTGPGGARGLPQRLVVHR
ncbi:MAG: T9SS type A sorting domain-containing protein [Flavobacteriales bacterium]|nr:T9SS type A sorting domain-containing protein [Flavobacteriales bacterium]